MTLVDELGNPGQCYTTGSIKSSKSRFKVQNRRSDIVGREDDSKIKQSTKFTATVLKSEKGDVTARGDTVGIVITHNVGRIKIPCSMKFMRFELPVHR